MSPEPVPINEISETESEHKFAGPITRPVDSIRPQPTRAIWIGLGVTGAIVASILFFMFSHQKPATESKDPLSTAVLTVSTSKAKMQNTARHLSVNGSISAWDPLSIGAEVQGLRIEKMNVEEGDQVKEGQVLATLNSSILRAQLEQQRAHLRADVAGLRKAIQPNRVEDLNTWRAALKQAEANVAQEEANLFRAQSNLSNLQEHARRYTELRKQGAVSQMETDNTTTSAKTASADASAAEKKVDAMKYALRQAKERLAMAESGGRQEDILISEAGMHETRAKVQQLEAQIEQTIIRAPDDGKIIKREAHLGEISTAGKTMFVMVRDNRLELRAYIPETDLHKLTKGQLVRMTPSIDDQAPDLNAGHGAASGTQTATTAHSGSSRGIANAISGQIREISPSVDERTRLGMVRIDIPNTHHSVKPGQFFHAKIDLGPQEVLTVPSRAVLNRDEKDVVFVVKDNHATLRHVVIGEPLGELVEVRSGLDPGEEVIVSGAGFMKNGDLVRTAPQNTAP